MKNNNRQQLIRNMALISLAITLSIVLSAILLLSTTSIINEKVQAMSSVITNNNKTIMTSHNSNATSSLGLVDSPFYEANVGKVIGQRIASTATDSPEIEQSITESGTIKGVGNVTNLQTWKNTFRSPVIFYGIGQGIITTADGQMATWTGYDIGRSNNNGAIIYHGITFFDTSSTGKLAFLKNLVGLHTTEVDGNKQTTKIWEWK